MESLGDLESNFLLAFGMKQGDLPPGSEMLCRLEGKAWDLTPPSTDADICIVA